MKKLVIVILPFLFIFSVAYCGCSDYPEAAYIYASSSFCNTSGNSITIYVEDENENGELFEWDAMEISVVPAEAYSHHTGIDMFGEFQLYLNPDFTGEITLKIRGKNNKCWPSVGQRSGPWSNELTINVDDPGQEIDGSITGNNILLEGKQEDYNISSNFHKNILDLYQGYERIINEYNLSTGNYTLITDGLSGDYVFKLYGKNACGSTTNHIDENIHIVEIPDKPLGNENVYVGQSLMYSISNYDNEADGYDWYISPGGIAQITENNFNSIELTFIDDGVIQLKARAKSNTNYGDYSEVKSIAVNNGPLPPSKIFGPSVVCNGNNTNNVYEYSCSNIHNATSYQWQIVGSGVDIVGESNTNVIHVEINNSATNFDLRVRALRGVWSDYIEKNITVTTNNVEIDFENVNSCSGQGEIEIEGILPEGGVAWVENFKNITSKNHSKIYRVRNDEIMQGGSSTNPLGNHYDDIKDIYLYYDLSGINSSALVKEASLVISMNNISIINVCNYGTVNRIPSLGETGLFYNSKSGQALNIGEHNKSIDPNTVKIDMTDIVQSWIKLGNNCGMYLAPPLETFEANINSGNMYLEITYYTKNTINTNVTGNTYTVLYEIENGECSSSKTDFVTIKQTPQVIFSPPSYCLNELPEKISGGSSDMTGSDEYISEYINGSYFSTDNSGGYDVTYRFTANNGCSNQVTDHITVFDYPDFELISQDEICQGSQLTVSIPGASQYTNKKWTYNGSTAINQNAVTFIPGHSGEEEVKVEVTDMNGCSNEIVETIVVNEVPEVKLDDINVCKNEFVNIIPDVDDNGSQFLNYKWSNGSTTENLNILATNSLTYSLTVTNEHQCSATDDMQISAMNLPVVTAEDKTICSGTTTILKAEPFIQGYNYSWSNGYSGNEIDVTLTESSTFRVWVTDLNGCKNYDDVYVNVHPKPSFTIPDKIACFGDVVTLSTSGSFNEYLWSTGDNSSSINVMANESQQISCTVTDNYGCQATELMQLTVVHPSPLSMEDVQACKDEQVQLTGPDGFVEYYWSNGIMQKDNTVLADETKNYTLNVVDINGCKNSKTLTVYANPYPIVNIPDVGVNEGQSVLLSAPEGYSGYLWSTGHTTADIEIFPPEESEYWIMVTSEKGCSTTDHFLVRIYDLPIINLANHSICAGESVTLQAPPGFVKYKWSTGENTGSVIVQPDQTTVFSLEVENETGGIGGSQAIVYVNQIPEISLENKTICKGDDVELKTTYNSSYTYSWSHTASNASQLTVSPGGTTDYSLHVTDTAGCINSAKCTVFVQDPDAHFLANQTSVKPGEIIKFYVENPHDYDSLYTWDFGDGYNNTGKNQMHVYNDEGIFDVTLSVLTDLGCQSQEKAEGYINVNELNLQASNDIIRGDFNINIYPVPVLDHVFVDFSSCHVSDNISLKIFSITGKEIYSADNIASSILDIDMSRYQPGLYHMHITKNETLKSVEIVKVQ